MKTRPMVIIGLLGLSTQAQALPAEAVASFFSKLFKGGVVAKETVTAGRAAEGAAAQRGLSIFQLAKLPATALRRCKLRSSQSRIPAPSQ